MTSDVMVAVITPKVTDNQCSNPYSLQNCNGWGSNVPILGRQCSNAPTLEKQCILLDPKYAATVQNAAATPQNAVAAPQNAVIVASNVSDYKDNSVIK